MAEELFKEEIKFPEDLETMLSMSLQYDKLQNVIRFILDLLKRHEHGLTVAFSKQNTITPEVNSFHSYKEKLDTRVSSLEKAVNKTNIKLEDVKQNLDNRGDTVETLKFLLNMITEHDALILQYKKQINDLQQEKNSFNLRLSLVEENFKEPEFDESDLESKRIPVDVNSLTVETHNYEADRKSIIEDSLQTPEATKNKEGILKKTAYQAPNRRYKKTGNKKQEKIQIPAVTSENPGKTSIVTEKSKQSLEISASKSLFNSITQDSPKKVITEDPNRLLFSSETQKVLSESKEKSPTFELTAPNLPAHLKDLETRLANLEKMLENPEEKTEVKSRLGKLESMYKFIEGILDSCEPLTLRNRDELMKLVRSLKNLESSMVNKLNTEEFDAIKTLVIALASGSPKYDPSPIFPTREINTIRVLEKKISEIEVSISDVVKIYPENIEEVVLKLRRIEQKLEIKADWHMVDEVKDMVNDLIEKNKQMANLISSKDKNMNSFNNKATESSLLASLNRRVSNFEEIIRNLKIPYGMDLSHTWEEVKKLWESQKAVISSFEELKKQENYKNSEILQKIDNKAENFLIQALEDKLKKITHELTDKFNGQFVEKNDMRRGMRYLETMIKSLEGIKSKPEGEDAMLARKPLGGWSCASCEKKLESLTGRIASHSP